MQESKKAIPEPNFFQCPNIIIDEYLKELSGSELKCFLFIVRKTKGWHKDVDAISISQFEEYTGLSNRAVIDACNSLVIRGFIFQDVGQRGIKLFTLDCKKFTCEKSSPVKKVHSTHEKSSQVTSEKSSHTKETIQKKLSKESCSDVAIAIAANISESVDDKKTSLAQVTVAEVTQPTKKQKPTPEESAANKATWLAYSSAYKNRYSVEPLRNAQVNGIISKFVKMVGADDAPNIARFFINISNQFYVQKLHDVKLLLSDAQAIRTQWLTKRTVSTNQARQADAVQAAQSSVDGVLARRAKRAAEANFSESVIDGECRNV